MKNISPAQRYTTVQPDNTQLLEQFSAELNNFPSSTNKITRLFLAEVRRLIEPDICALFLTDDKSHEFMLQEAIPRKYRRLCQQEIDCQIEAGIFGWVINHKRPAALPALAIHNSSRDEKTVLILSPLCTARNTPGMFLAAIPSSKMPYVQHSLDTLAIICRHFAITLESLQLYYKLKQRNRMLAASKKQSDEKYKHLFDTSKDGIFQLNSRGKLVTANPAWLKMFGFKSLAEAKQYNLNSLFPAAGRQRLEQAIRQQGYISNYIMHVSKKDGQPMIIEATCNLISEGIQGIVRDITERKKLEERLIRSEKLKAMGEIASSVAHDFNNILNIIYGRIQMMNMQSGGNADKNLSLLEKAARDGIEIVRRIQNFSRITPGKNPADINEILEDALAFISLRLKSKTKQGINITLEKRLAATLPVQCNPSELREAFTNILVNAIDAMPCGGRIAVDASTNNDRVHISIKDTGIGMSEETKKKIFEPFFTTKGDNGNGLGMHIVHSIIHNHGGEISVESEPGKGTEIKITLPAINQPDTRPSLLVIDDDDNLRFLLTDILNSEGYETAAASNGNEGLNIFQQNAPQIVITDLNLPDINGWQVVRAIKNASPNTPVIMITGDNIPAEEAHLKQRGVDTILKKPFDLTHLISLISNLA